MRRALPSKARQTVGPIIFFDRMGRGGFLTGQGLDVRAAHADSIAHFWTATESIPEMSFVR